MKEEGQIPKSACLRLLISEKQRPGLWGRIPPALLAWKQKVDLGSHPFVTLYGPLRTGILVVWVLVLPLAPRYTLG